jgi:hypothetical protein
MDKTLADLAYAHTNAGNWDLADKFCTEALIEASSSPRHWRAKHYATAA